MNNSGCWIEFSSHLRSTPSSRRSTKKTSHDRTAARRQPSRSASTRGRGRQRSLEPPHFAAAAWHSCARLTSDRHASQSTRAKAASIELPSGSQGGRQPRLTLGASIASRAPRSRRSRRRHVRRLPAG